MDKQKMQPWEPEIEEDNDWLLDEEMEEQIEIAEGYGDFLLQQVKNGQLKRK